MRARLREREREMFICDTRTLHYTTLTVVVVVQLIKEWISIHRVLAGKNCKCRQTVSACINCVFLINQKKTNSRQMLIVTSGSCEIQRSVFIDIKLSAIAIVPILTLRHAARWHSLPNIWWCVHKIAHSQIEIHLIYSASERFCWHI